MRFGRKFIFGCLPGNPGFQHIRRNKSRQCSCGYLHGFTSMWVATDTGAAALDFKNSKTMQADLLAPGQRFCRRILECIQNYPNGCDFFASSAGDESDKLVSTHSSPLHTEV